MHAATPSRAPWWQSVALAALLVAAAVLAYWPALNGGFLWDDDTLLTKSELVKAADGLHRIWFTTEPLDYWPLTNSSFWLEWRLWGMHPAGYHFTNLFLHIACGLLLWAILRRLSIPGAFLAACAFVLHPVNVESVAWIAQRKNTLSMVFFLLSILWYLTDEIVRLPPQRAQNARRGPRLKPDATDAAEADSAVSPRRQTARKRQKRKYSLPPVLLFRDRRLSLASIWYWLSLAAFVLAMLSKGSVAILPGVLLLLVWWQRGPAFACRRDGATSFGEAAPKRAKERAREGGSLTRADLLRTAPFFAVAALLTLLNIWFQMHLTTGPIRDVTLVQRALGAGAVVWFYLSKALAPVGLIFVYPQWEIRSEEVRWWLPSIAAVATTVLLLGLRRRPWGRALLFAWLFFGLALVPVMGLTDVYYMSYSLVADHYQYIAIIGVVSGIAAGLSLLMSGRTGSEDGRPRPGSRLALAVLSGAWLAVLGTATWRQSHQYASAETLYRATLEANPSCWLVHDLLGVLLADRSVDEAVSHFREAIRLKPDMVSARNNLCNASQQLGRTDDAIAECSAALRIDPNLPVAHNALGAALAARGRPAEARPEFEAALRLKGDFAAAHNNLANVLAASGHEAEAIQHYRDALRAAPDFAAAHSNLGAALEKQGSTQEAVEQYREALRLDPGLAPARARLDALARKSGGLEAIARYQEAARLHPDNARAHVDLGDALLEAARPQEAAAEYATALKLLPDSPAIHNGLAVALADLGRTAEAEGHFREAIRLKPDFAAAHLGLADLLQEDRRLEEAAVQYGQALKSDPRAADAHNNLGVVLVRLGRPDEAVDHFRAAIALRTDYADARENLRKTLARRATPASGERIPNP